uniref:Cone-rod homeobox n=1 Tax=Coturnix japonica TaxID=93934 RepID=A0A8C2SS10_COTJA
MMSYIKQPHYAVNGLTLAGPGMDLLHSAVGYPAPRQHDVKRQLTFTSEARAGHLLEALFFANREVALNRFNLPLLTSVISPLPPPQVWFKNAAAKLPAACQGRASGSPRPAAKKKPTPPRNPKAHAGGPVHTSPTPARSGTGPPVPCSSLLLGSHGFHLSGTGSVGAPQRSGFATFAPFVWLQPYNQTAPYGQSYGGSAAYFGGAGLAGPTCPPCTPHWGLPAAALSPLGAPMGCSPDSPSPAAFIGEFWWPGWGLGLGRGKLNFNAADCLDYKEQSSWKFQCCEGGGIGGIWGGRGGFGGG